MFCKCSHYSLVRGKRSTGFTLLELLIVMAIATIITTALVIQNSRWNDQLIVSTQAYELALMIRQAQVYSLGVRENVGGSGDKFNVGYGVAFDYGNLAGYTFFVDNNRNQAYDSGEALETKNFNRGVQISEFCGVKTVGSQEERCSPNGGGLGNVVKGNVSFFRPEPKANLVFLNNGGQPSNNVVGPLKVRLTSPQGRINTVVVYPGGQVSVVNGVF